MASGSVRKQTNSGERDKAAPVGVRSAAGRSAAILEWAQDVQTCLLAASARLLRAGCDALPVVSAR